jgi:hypothetical protein
VASLGCLVRACGVDAAVPSSESSSDSDSVSERMIGVVVVPRVRKSAGGRGRGGGGMSSESEGCRGGLEDILLFWCEKDGESNKLGRGAERTYTKKWLEVGARSWFH